MFHVAVLFQESSILLLKIQYHGAKQKFCTDILETWYLTCLIIRRRPVGGVAKSPDLTPHVMWRRSWKQQVKLMTGKIATL
jgi:hypothetical protein